ncbi:MAG TPA: glycosyltransferase family A protein [Polyangia bacterium]|nr:glycosyltransferase family A protein [Polyangia bacterium]
MPCKGRLAFLAQSLPTFLDQADLVCCLVDYDCPEGCGDWAEATYPEAARAGRLVVVRAKNRPLFNKSAAHNLGSRAALAAGAAHVVFADADTLLAPGFSSWLRPRLENRKFWIAALRPDGCDELGLYGLLVAPARALEATRGYDERFEGWGSEDLDLRLRLRFAERLELGEVPLDLLRGLPHDSALRTQFYAEKDWRASNRRNQLFMVRKLRMELGILPGVLTTLGGRLWCRPPPREGAGRPGGETAAGAP